MDLLRKVAGLDSLMYGVKVNLLDKGGVIHQIGGEPVHGCLPFYNSGNREKRRHFLPHV